MKPIVLIVVVVAIAAGLAACGPSSDMKGMDKQTTSKSGDTKGMDMKSSDMKGMDMKGSDKAQGVVHQATGKVSKVDSGSGTVTIDHGPVASMKWPSMTMAFKVQDKAMLDKMKPGATIDFGFTESGKDYLITSVK
jgi:Cu(I)/Ag(I) efflux system periplasmic protein CusF